MNGVKTAVLLAALTALLLVIGSVLAGQVGLFIAIIFAVIMNFSAYWFSDQLVLKMYRAQEVGPYDAPELYQTVEELAHRGNMPMPKVYLVPDQTPNAFATGRNPENAAVAATEGLIQMLSREELAGVMAHEMAHVRHRDTLIGTVSATLAGAIGAIANIALLFSFFRSSDEEGPGPIATLVMAILAPVAASLIQMAVSRSREFAADRGGAELCGNPLWLASALEKLASANQRQPMRQADEHPATAHMFIVNPLSGREMMRWFSTHPPLEERIRRLQQMAKKQ
ncbi:protease HtpX [Piscirickettsia salmonis]|uniref:Protease HtpX n=1 Tax=Piscirickettsia salmonis TaxID=1238 RepID=A0A9Q6LVD7_PISSA|nr:zinc metalloprotease HtpX [Piscirickettsia salmonis]RNC77020.1 zinc metalloprotease HtpX [Piscirickettsiaceae bacterium NZ-RLO2]ALA23695.1 peptidase M48 family protein HtpX [Piscirickettsia salmonis]APS44133.1 protease HtpX [Piscirickettsia salmonis]APS47494.1 protease HtpX [Piscirickettsia salmonis]APS51071.1 protease HtpX [Piscirickettsia salmonis]